MCKLGSNQVLLPLVCVSLCVVLISMTTALDADTDDGVHQKVNYDLSEQKQGRHQLHARGMHKRSATSLNYDEIHYRSLTAFCSELSSDVNTEGMFEESPESPNYEQIMYSSLASFCSQLNTGDNQEEPKEKPDVTKPGPVFLTSWTGPDIFPLRVEAQKIGNTIHASFEIVHTGPAFLLRTSSFEAIKTPIEYPAMSSGALQSRVNITIDATVCKYKTRQKHARVSYSWFMENSSDFQITTTLDICKFGKMPERSKEYYSSRQKKLHKGGKVTQDVPIRLFKINPDNGEDGIIIEKYNNVSLDIELHLPKSYTLRITAYIWDRDLKQLIYSHVDILLDGPYKKGEVDKFYKNSPFVQSRLEKSLLETTTLTNNDTVLVKIKVNTANGRRSGQLVLSYKWLEADHGRSPFVTSVEQTQSLSLRLKGSGYVFPQNMAMIVKADLPLHYKVYCSPETGRTCGISCHAFGTDIKSISIEKVKVAGDKRVVYPVQNVSYVVDKEAYAFIDTGPVSSIYAGKYECVVRRENGKRLSQEIVLYTEQVTKLSYVSLDFFPANSAGVQMARLTCVAHGSQPLNFDFYLIDEEQKQSERVGKEYDRRTVNFPHYTSIAVSIPAVKLMYPWAYIHIKASGKRGSTTDLLPIDTEKFKYYPEPPVIDRMPNASYLSVFSNGTLKVVCSAIGQPPIKIAIFPPVIPPGQTREDAELGKQNGSFSDEKETWTRTTLYLTTSSVGLMPTIDRVNCEARRGRKQRDNATLYLLADEELSK